MKENLIQEISNAMTDVLSIEQMAHATLADRSAKT